MSDRRPASPLPGATLHPRNRHRGGLDFPRLVAASPPLAPFVFTNPFGNQTIDFADPGAVKALNVALLAVFYRVAWSLPDSRLCPSVPGRADYVHFAADLLAEANGGAVPRGSQVRVLDVGTGASGVYALIGHAEYGWRFTGSDIDREALASVNRIVQANPALRGAIEVILQPSATKVLEGVLLPGSRFDLTLCNPPFHSSAEEAAEGSRRKWRNLGRGGKQGARPVRNFGGSGAELWCPGGERAFVCRMIAESAGLRDWCLWFTSLVSKRENLPAIQRALQQVGAVEKRTVEMKQGQKTSRMVAWTFHAAREREQWSRERG